MATSFTGYDPVSLGLQSRKKLGALKKYGLPTAQEIQRINEQITPQENQLALQQLLQYGPQLTQAGLQLQGQQQLGGIQNNLAAINGPGTELVNKAQGLDQLLNPQWYQQRDATNQGYLSLLGGQDPNRLSGSELAETERGLNRLNTSRGNINVTDATTTAANAGAFGSALAGKQQRFGQALSLFPSLSGASRSPINSFGIATGQGNPQSTTGVSTGSQAGQGYDQQLAGLQNQYMQTQAARKPIGDVVQEAGQNAKCSMCYIFKEFYGYPDVPMYLRWVRDYEYRRNPKLARGYKKMSYWLIPIMRKSNIVRSLVDYLMIKPLSGYAQYLTGYSKIGWVFSPFRFFWLKAWSNI